MFITLLNRNDQSKILHMVTLYESILLQMADQVLPSLLSALQKESYVNMETNMTVVQHLVPSFQFNHAEVIVDNLERLMEKIEQNAFLAWSNPLMVMVLTLDVLFKLRGSHGSLSLRINSVCD